MRSPLFLLPIALALGGCAALCPVPDEAPAPAEVPAPVERPVEAEPQAPVQEAPAAQDVPVPAPGAYSAQAALDPEQRDVYAAATRDSEAHTLRPRTVAVQVVNGLNYDFRCLGEDGRRYSVIIHRPLPQSGQGPRVISIRELPAVD